MAYRNKPRVTMPSKHSERDSEWIASTLMLLSPAHQLKARVAYSDAYSSAFNAEEKDYKQENAARVAANTKLRIFKDRCLESYAQSIEKSMSEINEHKASSFTGF